MKDSFKILFYVIAIALWIVYKYREQKKNGLWEPRTNQPPMPIPQPTVKETRSTTNKPKALQTKSERGLKSVNTNSLDQVKTYESATGIERYNTPFLQQFLNDTEETGIPAEAFNESENDTPVIDIRQAIIGSEILRRPTW